MTRLTSFVFALCFFFSGCVPAGLPQQPTATLTPLSPTVTETVVSEQSDPSATPTTEQTQANAVDPQWIALIGVDGNIWLVDAVKGEKKQITQDGTPTTGNITANVRTYYSCLSWSADGTLLAYRKITLEVTASGTQWHPGIWVYAVGRGEAAEMLQNVNPSRLAFRPGTHLLAYDEALDPGYFTPGSGEPDASKARGIFSLNVDTGETGELVKPEYGLWLSEPRWSPDGQLLGFVEQTIYEEPAPFALYDFQTKVYTRWNQVIGGYAFAPDGQHIAYDRLSFGGFSGNERIWVSDLLGKAEQGFSPSATPMASDPVWSPKGDFLAYKLGEPASSPGHVGNILVVQGAAGGEARRLGSFGYMGPIAWSADGSMLVFSTGVDDQALIKVVTLADGSVKDLVKGTAPTASLPALPPAAEVVQKPSTSRISLDLLKNYTYWLKDFNIQVTLKDGVFSNDSIQCQLIEPAALGDLNGDGQGDAAVMLAIKSGGSGTFYNLITILDQNNTLVQTGFSYIGDRQVVKNLEIVRGRIILDYLTQGGNAPLCCPNEHRLRSYLLENGALLLTGEQILDSLEAQATPLPNNIIIDQPVTGDHLSKPLMVRGRVSQLPPEKKLTYSVTDLSGALLLQGEVPLDASGAFEFEIPLGDVPTGLIQVALVDSANGILNGRSIVVLVAP